MGGVSALKPERLYRPWTELMSIRDTGSRRARAQELRKLSICVLDICEGSNMKGSRTRLLESGFLGCRQSSVETQMLRLGIISF